MGKFTIIKHEYENTGGNCMVLFSEVYLHDEDRTVYGTTNEDGVGLYTVDNRYEEFCSHEPIVWYDVDMADLCECRYEKLARVLFNEFNKRYGELEVDYDWLTDELRGKVPNWYIERVHARGDNVYVVTDGTNVTLDAAYGEAPDAHQRIGSEEFCLTVSALRAFREAYYSLCESFTYDVVDELADDYPFDRSFDELEVGKWVNRSIVNLEKRWRKDHND